MNACDLKNHTTINMLQHTVKHSKVLGLNLHKMEHCLDCETGVNCLVRGLLQTKNSTTTTKLTVSFDSIFMFIFPWITEKEREREIKNKGDQFRLK